MTYKQIRINRTTTVDKILKELGNQYELLSESDIIKLALSQYYFETKKRNTVFEKELLNLPVRTATKEEEKIINEAVKNQEEGQELSNCELINLAKNA